MSMLLPSVVVSVIIAILAAITQPKQQAYGVPESESKVVTVVRVFIISFVCIYFGMSYFLTPVCPDILQNEPDF